MCFLSAGMAASFYKENMDTPSQESLEDWTIRQILGFVSSYTMIPLLVDKHLSKEIYKETGHIHMSEITIPLNVESSVLWSLRERITQALAELDWNTVTFNYNGSDLFLTLHSKVACP